MTNKKLVGVGNRLYTSPLAEEFFVFFEENILSNTTTSTLKGRTSGDAGSAGYNSDFDGGSIDH